MMATAQILPAPSLADPFTDLPAMWLADHWRFPPGVVPGVAGQLPEAVLFDWTGVHPSLAAQLKWTIATRCLQRTWRAQNLRAIRTIVKRIVGFLRVDARQVTSVLDRDLDEWQLHLRSHLIATGAYRPETHSHLTRFAPGEVKQYQREDPTIRVFRLLCAMVVEELDPRQEYDKDVWSLRRLGISGRASVPVNHLTFTRIAQQWLKFAVKRYCQYTLVKGAVSSCNEAIYIAGRFSEYLAESHPDLVGADIDRNVLLGFVPFLERVGYSHNGRYSTVSDLRTMLEYCGREALGGLKNRVLLYKQDLPPRTAAIPRFIPDAVVRALNAHLDDLPEDQQRMLLVIEEVGMRAGELCEAPFDCLLNDNDGDYFFLYYQGKMRKEHHVPITRELAKVVKEQQSYMRERFTGQSLPYLFMTRRSQPYKR